MSKPNQLYLLADHVKLSLLERQRAKSLNLDDDTQDGHISRSLDQFRDGLVALREEKRRLDDGDDATYVLSSGASACSSNPTMGGLELLSDVM